jgi:uncharacterized protein
LVIDALQQRFTTIFNMKFQPDTISVQSISGYGPGWVGIKNEKITNSIVIGSRGERFDWVCKRFEDLTAEHFAQLAALNTELIIFGSGKRIQFPPSSLIKSLIDKQIGLETMDTQAACRTYNILAGEGRQVAVALLLEADPG